MASHSRSPAPKDREPVKATSPVPVRSNGSGQDMGPSQAAVTVPSGFGVPYATLPGEIADPVPSPVAMPMTDAPPKKVATVPPTDTDRPTPEPRGLGRDGEEPPPGSL